MDRKHIFILFYKCERFEKQKWWGWEKTQSQYKKPPIYCEK